MAEYSGEDLECQTLLSSQHLEPLGVSEPSAARNPDLSSLLSIYVSPLNLLH